MKKIILMLLVVACTQVNKEHETALTDFKDYATALLEKSKTEKFSVDTMFQETPIDPNDPTITRIDTIVTLPINGDNNPYHYSPQNYMLKEEISKYVVQTDSLLKGASKNILDEYAKYKTAIDTLYSFKYEKNN